MASREPVPGFLLIDICIIIALVIFTAFRNLTGGWDYILSGIVFLLLLWVIATRRHWSIAYPLLFIRSTVVSDIILGWLAALVALAVSWFIGTALARSYSDLMGVLVGLVVFGACMLAVSASKNWQ